MLVMKKLKTTGKQALQKNTSLAVLGNVAKKAVKFSPPRKPKNADRRSREHLSPKEVGVAGTFVSKPTVSSLLHHLFENSSTTCASVKLR